MSHTLITLLEMDLSSIRLSRALEGIHRGMEVIPVTGTSMTSAVPNGPELSFADKAPGLERATRTGSSALKRQPGFTTENHGVARRFFKPSRRASTPTPESNTRRRKYFLKINIMEAAPRQWIARSAQGPVSPCASVVLRVLRGKTWRCRSERIAHQLGHAPFTLASGDRR